MSAPLRIVALERDLDRAVATLERIGRIARQLAADTRHGTFPRSAAEAILNELDFHGLGRRTEKVAKR